MLRPVLTEDKGVKILRVMNTGVSMCPVEGCDAMSVGPGSFKNHFKRAHPELAVRVRAVLPPTVEVAESAKALSTVWVRPGTAPACPACAKVSKSLDALRKHLRKMHGELPITAREDTPSNRAKLAELEEAQVFWMVVGRRTHCPMAGCSFSHTVPETLSMHLRRKHEGHGLVVRRCDKLPAEGQCCRPANTVKLKQCKGRRVLEKGPGEQVARAPSPDRMSEELVSDSEAGSDSDSESESIGSCSASQLARQGVEEDSEEGAFEAAEEGTWCCPYENCQFEALTLHALKSHHHRTHAGSLLDEGQVRGPGGVRAEFVAEREKVGTTASVAKICVDGQELEQVSSFPYLGSIIEEDGSAGVEVRSRMKKAGHSYGVLKKPLWSQAGVSLKRKGQVYTAVVLSTLLYGAEAWALSKLEMRRLDAYHLRCLRSIAKMPGVLRSTNAAVLETVGCQAVQNMVLARRLRWFGHVRRMDQRRWPARLLGAVLPGQPRVGGKRMGSEARVRDDCKRRGCDNPWTLCLDRVAWRTACGRMLTCGQKR